MSNCILYVIQNELPYPLPIGYIESDGALMGYVRESDPVYLDVVQQVFNDGKTIGTLAQEILQRNGRL